MLNVYKVFINTQPKQYDYSDYLYKNIEGIECGLSVSKVWEVLPTFVFGLSQGCSILVLKAYCPACFTHIPAQIHLIQWFNDLFMFCRSLLITH